MKNIILLIITFVTMAFPLQAYLELKDYIITPETIKKIGIYHTGNGNPKSMDLFFEFQNRIILELQNTPWFDVYSYDRIVEYSSRFYKDDPTRFLFSLDAILIADMSSNNNLLIKAHFPRLQKQSSVFEENLNSKKSLDVLMDNLSTTLRKRLALSGEILSMKDGTSVLVNLGRNFNISKNELFISFTSNSMPSGVLKVVEVNDLSLKAEILWQQEKISPGDSVLKSTPELLLNLKSKHTKTDIRKKITLSGPTRIPSLESQKVSFFPHPSLNAFIISDKANTFFMNLDNNQTMMIEKDRIIKNAKWKPGTLQAAYVVSNTLFLYDMSRVSKLLLKQNPEPSFIQTQLVYDTAHQSEILDFCWDMHGKNLAFFIKGKGLFLTADLKEIKKIDIPTVYKDTSSAQILFSSDGRTVHIKTPNHFDRMATIHSYNLDSEEVRRIKSVRSQNSMINSENHDGILDYLIDDRGRTNLCNITGKSNETLFQGFKKKGILSPDNSLHISRDRRVLTYSLTNHLETSTQLTQIEQMAFFPASRKLVCHGFLKDTNKDKVIDWKDNKSIFLFEPRTSSVEAILVEDADEFMGIANTGEYIFYRTGKSVFYRRISN